VSEDFVERLSKVEESEPHETAVSGESGRRSGVLGKRILRDLE
jgi:hypothetical protein